MRRIALLGSVLLVSGCAGFADFAGDTFTYGTNPNRPLGNSENMRRVSGLDAVTEPLGPEPGNIWPVAIEATPTLQDLERQGNMPQQPPPAPYLPDHRQPRPAVPPGSSTPPVSNQPPLAPELNLPPQPPAPTVSAPPPAPPSSGQAVQTRRGPGVTSGGTGGYQTLTTPQGQAIMVPNGNGTSTVIYPDGRVETVPTPR